MLQVEVIDSVFEGEESVVNWLETLCLIGMLTVMIIKVDGKESSDLCRCYLPTTHQLHQSDSFKASSRDPNIQSILSGHDFRLISDHREFRHLIIVGLFLKLL